MSSASITIDQSQVLISLGGLQASVADRDGILKVAGELMRASVLRTFREEGSPAGSWPALAASTLRRKGYTAGHKLLILSGRLFNSISYVVSGGQLTIGTNVVYAAVHQYGSADRQGSQAGGGPKLNRDHVRVSSYDALRVMPFRRYGHDARADKNGRQRNLRVRAQGPDNASRFTVPAHQRHQNIPARPYLVVRPEDPARLVAGTEAYLHSRSKALGGGGAQ